MPFRLICGVSFLLIHTATVAAQLPSPALDFVFPAGGQAGSTVAVQVGGRDLDDATHLVFSHPGMTGRVVMHVPSEFEAEPQPVAGQFEVTIPLNVPPGNYDVRAVGRFGVSTPLTFVVGDVPEQVENGQHLSPETAAELPMDAVMNGRTDAGAVDYYRFTASEGQSLIIECLARQIDTKLAPVITIWDASGRQLARSAHLFDPLVDFQVPTTGDYLLGINDHTFGGGNDHHYRLRIYTGPYLVSISPLVALAGATARFAVEGRNLPGGERVPEVTLDGAMLERKTISLFVPQPSTSSPLIVDPVAALPDSFAFNWSTDRGSSNHLSLAYATHPVIAEAEANNTPETAQQIAVPCEYSGRFYPRRDQDWVQFKATGGHEYQVRVISNRLGIPTDPEVFVQKVTQTADGKTQTSQVSIEDDYRSDRDRFRQPLRRALELSHHDPVVRFTADQDSDYRVGLRDLNGSSLDDPRFAYRLVIEPQRPDFHLVAWSQRQATDDDKKIDRQSLVIPRAGTLPVLIDVLRQGGFDQPVRISAQQLPPGVTAGACEVAAGQTEAVLTLTASDQSVGWCGPIQIVGEAEIDGRTERRVACEAVLTGNTDNVEQQRPAARLARQIVLAVVDRQPAPAQVIVGSADANASPIWETSIGAKLAIPLRLAKHAELTAELALAAVGLPEKIKASEVKFAPDATDAQLQLTLDAADIPPGTYCVFLRGIAKSTFVRNPDAIARAQARRTAFNDTIAQLDQQVQQAADRLARAQQSVAQRTALVSKFQSVPQSIQQTLQAATQQVAQVQAQLTALPSAADLASATATPSAAAADDGQLLAALEELTQSLGRSTAEAMAQLQKAGAGFGQMNELRAVAESQLQAAQAAVVQAEASHEQATAKRRRADEFVKQLDQQLAEAQKNFGPSELASYVHSPSFTLKVARSPLTSTLPSEPIKLRPGETREVPVTIRRRFDFADAVQVTLQAPDGSSQIVAEPRRIERGRDSNTLQVTAGSDAPPGEHTLSVVLKLKFNGVEVQDQVPLKVVVAQP